MPFEPFDAGAVTPGRCIEELETDTIGRWGVDIAETPDADYFQPTLETNDSVSIA
jgi:hypothetical protein